MEVKLGVSLVSNAIETILDPPSLKLHMVLGPSIWSVDTLLNRGSRENQPGFSYVSPMLLCEL